MNTLGIALFLSLLFLLERFFPLRAARRPLAARLFVNVVFSLLTYGTAWVLVRPVIEWTGGQGVGVFRWLRLGIVPELVGSVLLLDLTFYYWHRANHEWAFLWRFHNVHHFDPDLDVTTAFRFHFGEVALSTVFRAAQMLVLGVSPWALVTFEAIFQSATFFHHSNVRLPLTLERFLSRALVSPRLHGIHHSQEKPETNSNYAVIFNWWDRLHGTFRDFGPVNPLVGVPGYDRPEDNSLAHSLKAPFVPQRDYWPSP